MKGCCLLLGQSLVLTLDCAPTQSPNVHSLALVMNTMTKADLWVDHKVDTCHRWTRNHRYHSCSHRWMSTSQMMFHCHQMNRHEPQILELGLRVPFHAQHTG